MRVWTARRWRDWRTSRVRHRHQPTWLDQAQVTQRACGSDGPLIVRVRHFRDAPTGFRSATTRRGGDARAPRLPRWSRRAERGARLETVAVLDETIQQSADPAASRLVLERVLAARPEAAAALADEPQLAAACVAISGLSRPLSRVLETDAEALGVLAALDRRPAITAATPEELLRWKNLEM